jgi:hypothetical protein
MPLQNGMVNSTAEFGVRTACCAKPIRGVGLAGFMSKFVGSGWTEVYRDSEPHIPPMLSLDDNSIITDLPSCSSRGQR